MSISQIIFKEIARIPIGEPFTVERLKQYGQWRSIQKCLSRMTQSGELDRIDKGIYAKPIRVRRAYRIIRTGKVLVDCIEETTHETVIKSGAHAVNLLGISTQAQIQEMYYWTGRSKSINIEGKIITLCYINKKYANKSHPLLELFLSAAYFLGRKKFTIETLKLVEQRLGKDKILEMEEYLLVMPMWVMTVFRQYFSGIKNG